MRPTTLGYAFRMASCWGTLHMGSLKWKYLVSAVWTLRCPTKSGQISISYSESHVAGVSYPTDLRHVQIARVSARCHVAIRLEGLVPGSPRGSICYVYLHLKCVNNLCRAGLGNGAYLQTNELHYILYAIYLMSHAKKGSLTLFWKCMLGYIDD